MEQQPWPAMDIGRHATIEYDEVRRSGMPSDPTPFPRPVLRRARRDVEVAVLDGNGIPTNETVCLASEDGIGAAGAVGLRRAYRFLRLLRIETDKSLARNGELWLCQMLVADRLDGGGEQVAFQIPPDGGLVAIKVIDKSLSGAEDAGRTEAAAMQFVRPDNNEHVVSSVEALEDYWFLYIVMEYCEGGDIFSAIFSPQIPEAGTKREAVVRYYFRQMLQCLHYLQSMGICHGDLSPENVMLKNGRCVFIDLDTCLRVPLSNGDRHGRKLIQPRVLSAKYPYMAPEIFLSRLPDDVRSRCARRGVTVPAPAPFDGFATDLWTLGTTLYVMLTADEDKLYSVPFGPLDMKYESLIEQGNLAAVLSQGEVTGFSLSEEAVDLLGRMLRPNPADRLTLEQVINHPWVRRPEIVIPE